MKQLSKEDKQLLLKDLCTRLPYGLKTLAKTHKDNKVGKVITITTKFINYSNDGVILGELYTDDECFWLDYGLFKPYLRPMPSMTEEEKEEYHSLMFMEYSSVGDKYYRHTVDSIDWLNSHQFDYRGLIEKGLAIEAPEGMYNLKEK